MRRRAKRISESECVVQIYRLLHPDRAATARILRRLCAGVGRFTFLIGVNTGVSQICCVGPGASVALQVQGCVVGILAVLHALAAFSLDGCHSAPSCLVDQVFACLVACSAIKNKVNSLSGTLAQLIVSWGDPEVGCLQYVQE